MISIVMADDHPMIREGIRSMIERYANLKVLGEASGGAQALELVERLQPDVLLLDLRMPDMDGPEVTREARRICPRTRVLILTTYDTDRDILAAIEAGAGGYVLKDIEPARLAEAIRATAGGRTVLDQRAAEAVANRMRGESREEEGLSGQEERVLSLAAGGKTNRQIARILNLGETTVKTYFSRIFAKLGVADRTSAVVEAMRRGIIPSRDGQA
jgi:nitrate/nitrite response regulator protein narL